MTAPQPTTTLGDRPAGVHRLHQPRRAVLACVEVLIAAGLIVLAVWLWRTGVLRDELPVGDGESRVLLRYVGDRLALSVGAGCLAGILALDSIRQFTLAIRTRPRPEPLHGPVPPPA
ncbi:hypothetical protein FHR81_002523 [Actinoalloteichus hoggarensis]|nr:hypothetical protein [Actinoalloteichus hoggarensis]MBB5921483.1 hypothetical protein [Actinoalloteichus hoggarensis]